jgi:hypothetical protein
MMSAPALIALGLTVAVAAFILGRTIGYTEGLRRGVHIGWDSAQTVTLRMLDALPRGEPAPLKPGSRVDFYTGSPPEPGESPATKPMATLDILKPWTKPGT